MWIPVRKHWQLNERHYGALQGKNKVEAVASFGEAQVNKWRRGYAVQPPLVDVTDADYPKFDARYAGVPEQHVPRGESLKDVSARVLPFWLSDILPLIRSGQKVLVAAHGNSLRSLLKHLERLSEAEIEAVNIPTGLAKIYTLDADGLAKDTSYVGDPVDVQARIHSVANQTKKG